MSADRPCDVCGHPVTMSRCWRLTCPTNGAQESFEHVDPRPAASRHLPGQEKLL